MFQDDHPPRDLVKAFRELTANIRNNKVKLAALKESQRKESHNHYVDFIEDDEGLASVPVLQNRALTLIKDIVTRWNSTELMLSRCLKVRSSIVHVQATYSNVPPISDDEWKCGDRKFYTTSFQLSYILYVFRLKSSPR